MNLARHDLAVVEMAYDEMRDGRWGATGGSLAPFGLIGAVTGMSTFLHKTAAWAKLLRRLERWAGGSVDAEDLLQTAYERLYRSRERVAIRNPVSFLYRAAVNAGIDNVRKDRLIDGSFDIENDGPLLIDGAPLPDEALVSRERLERVREGIRRLPPRTREIFLMHRLEDVKYREIAVRLGISQSAVEKHIARATLFLNDWSEGW